MKGLLEVVDLAGESSKIKSSLNDMTNHEQNNGSETG